MQSGASYPNEENVTYTTLLSDWFLNLYNGEGIQKTKFNLLITYCLITFNFSAGSM
jgi:hypothetical protein